MNIIEDEGFFLASYMKDKTLHMVAENVTLDAIKHDIDQLYAEAWDKRMANAKTKFIAGTLLIGFDASTKRDQTVEYEINTRTGEVSNVREYISPTER